MVTREQVLANYDEMLKIKMMKTVTANNYGLLTSHCTRHGISFDPLNNSVK